MNDAVIFEYKGWYISKNGDRGFFLWKPDGAAACLAGRYGKECEYLTRAKADCIRRADDAEAGK